MIIRTLILLAVWIGIAVLHFWVCKNRVWLDYDIACRAQDDCKYYFHRKPSLPTRRDLINKQYESGGPMIMLPGVNILILIGTWWSYMSAKCDYNEKYKQSELWDNKPLKR